ncbi:MAG TPA: hypothetical protein VJT49_28310 [Amycolatopsis sp.]|uniref:hypothetical protein n=1 Tax=Amycolatopsis sp. TaxID=37632 RepID=UPI002B45F52E|nr:hypothetical protein [Amycolatopsis sp.]HKS48942.1 hypothetical protein [Amycolatopsis sp.]
MSRGCTEFVRVHGPAGEPLRLRTGIPGPLTVRASWGRPHWHELPDGALEIEVPRGGEVLVHAAGARPDLTIAPVSISDPAKPRGLPPLPPAGQAVTVDLSSVLDNDDAITSEFYFGDGGFDGTGNTYPAAQLPQTGQLTADGVPFLFTNGSEGSQNNVVATGQTINVPADRYERLHLLGPSDNGNVSSTLIVAYTDGSTAQVPLRLTGWRSGAAFGETEAIRTGQMHSRTDPVNVQLAIFHQLVPLDPARELASITLPNLIKPRPHLFTATPEKP